MNSSSSEGYLKIGDVAREVGVSPSVIRSWESCWLPKARRPGASGGGRKCGSHWRASAAVTGEAKAFPGASGASGRDLSGISQCDGALADERVGGDAPQAGAVLQDQHPRFL